jgi:hypothetical protein
MIPISEIQNELRTIIPKSFPDSTHEIILYHYLIMKLYQIFQTRINIICEKNWYLFLKQPWSYLEQSHKNYSNEFWKINKYVFDLTRSSLRSTLSKFPFDESKLQDKFSEIYCGEKQNRKWFICENEEPVPFLPIFLKAFSNRSNSIHPKQLNTSGFVEENEIKPSKFSKLH